MGVWNNLPGAFTQTVYNPNLYGGGYGDENPLGPMSKYLGGDMGSLQNSIRDYLNPNSSLYSGGPPSWLTDYLKQQVVNQSLDPKPYMTSAADIPASARTTRPEVNRPTTYADVLQGAGGHASQVAAPTDDLFNMYMGMVGPALRAADNVRRGSAGAVAAGSPDGSPTTFDQMTYAAELGVRMPLAQAASQPSLSGIMGLMGLNRQRILNDDAYNNQAQMNDDSFDRQRLMAADSFDRQRYLTDQAYARSVNDMQRNMGLQYALAQYQARLGGIGSLANQFLGRAMAPGQQFQTAPLPQAPTAFGPSMGGEYAKAGGGATDQRQGQPGQPDLNKPFDWNGWREQNPYGIPATGAPSQSDPMTEYGGFA